MVTPAQIRQRFNWLTLEMGYEWSAPLNAFVNLDVELELLKAEVERCGFGPEIPRAIIPAKMVRTKASFATFQRAVLILLGRARGDRPSRTRRSNSH